MRLIRVKPTPKVVQDLVICYEYSRPYKFDGRDYMVKSLKKTGDGRSSRVEAELDLIYFGGPI